MTINIISGDITTAISDAIVNAANSRMLGGGGVDGAIHRAAGPALLKACYEVPEINGIRCPVGEARITEAGELNAKYIIHTVGPIYYGHKNPALALENAYRHSLQLAISYQCQSIAFPAISCGIYRYPPAQAATIAISVCNEAAFKQLDISFYLFDQSLVNIWQQALAATEQ